MPTAGMPHKVVPEPIDVDAQAIGAHAHIGNEELAFTLEQEEGAVAVSAKQVLVLFAKCFYLVLCQTQFVQIGFKRAKHLCEGRILCHFVRPHFRFFRLASHFYQVPNF